MIAPSEASADPVTATIRTLLVQIGGIEADVMNLPASADLYAAGFASLAAADLMVALEDHFGVEFPERLLNRRTFSSIARIAAAVAELRSAP